MTSFLNKLLEYYNITLEDYYSLIKDVNIYDVPNINDFSNGIITSNLLKSALKDNKKILIYGDYDADGMLATSILVYTFKKISYKNYSYYLPSRYLDGYGLSIKAVKKAIKDKVELIITVDNGISQIDAVKLARENNIDVIICDHHEIGNSLPDTKYIIHPIYSKYSDVICSGAFTSYVLSASILDLFDPYILSLSSISTISDMMKLVGYNRNIVRLGIKLMNENNFKQINLLADNLKIDEKVIGSSISPKLNSVGRMMENNKINFVVEFLTTNDEKIILKCFRYIQLLNEERKKITNEYQVNLDDTEPCIIEYLDIKEGLLGLLANKYLNKFEKPVFFLTSDFNDDSILKGSARGKNNFSIVDCLKSVGDVLIAYGGHESAGGFSLYKKDLDLFKKRIFGYCDLNQESLNNQIEPSKFISINESELLLENYEILENFSPFGVGNEEPLFKLSNVPTNIFNFSKDGKHIITKINKEAKLVYFNYNKDIISKEYVNLYGNINLNIFNNFKNINFYIKKFE